MCYDFTGQAMDSDEAMIDLCTSCKTNICFCVCENRIAYFPSLEYSSKPLYDKNIEKRFEEGKPVSTGLVEFMSGGFTCVS